MTTSRKARLAVLTVVAALIGGATAQATPPSPGVTATSQALGLQGLVDRIVALGAPGATLLVSDGDSHRTFTSGVADVRAERPLRSADRYRIGSVTKTLIATLALQLVEQGALDLDAPVADYRGQLLPDGEDITIRHLLNHTSGLFDYTGDEEFLDRLVAGDSFRPRELVAYSTRHDLLFPPGTQFSYSNPNYVVLGLVLRAVGDAKVKSQLAERILQPLALTATSFPIRDRTIPGRFSHGYLGDEGGELVEVTSYFSPTWAWAAGAMISNTVDLGAFYRGLLGGELLDANTLEAMKETVPAGEGLGSGLGLFVFELPCGTAYGHDGLYLGYYTMSISTEDGARQSVVMMNVDPANGFPPPDVLGAFSDAIVAGFCRTLDSDKGQLVGPTPDVTGAPLAGRRPASVG